MTRTLAFQIKPDFAEVDLVRLALKKLCDEIYSGADAQPLTGELCLAATEAMNNAVEHSGADQLGIEIFANRTEVFFQIVTRGKEFDPWSDIAMPVLGDGEALQEGGFGLAIIKEIVDSVHYEYIDGKNVMTLVKRVIGTKGGIKDGK